MRRNLPSPSSDDGDDDCMFCETSVHIYWATQYHITFYSHNTLPACEDSKEFTPQCENNIFLSLFIVLRILFTPYYIHTYKVCHFKDLVTQNYFFKILSETSMRSLQTNHKFCKHIKLHQNVKLIRNNNTFTASIRKVYVVRQDMCFK
jgi:hypothetical protein